MDRFGMMTAVAALAVAAALPPALAGVQQAARPRETAAFVPLGGDAALLAGPSCNSVVLRGEKGLMLIDAQRGGDVAAVRDLIDSHYRLPVVEIVNTHWHRDHSGGNAGFAQAGATILAQSAVAERMAQPQYMAAYGETVPPTPAAGRPGRNFAREVTLRFGTETVRLVHAPAAHTDGDALVKLERANVLHMGDIYMNGAYPFIDLSSGGSIQGLIRAVDTALRMSDARTAIVPGHGPVARRPALIAYRTMLVDVNRAIGAGVARGQSVDAVLAARPADAYGLAGDADRFVAAVYAGHGRRSGRRDGQAVEAGR